MRFTLFYLRGLFYVVVAMVPLSGCYFTGKAVGGAWTGDPGAIPMPVAVVADVATSPIQVPVHLVREANKKQKSEERGEQAQGAEPVKSKPIHRH